MRSNLFVIKHLLLLSLFHFLFSIYLSAKFTFKDFMFRGISRASKFTANNELHFPISIPKEILRE